MCGFVAMMSLHRPVDRSALERATSTLHHRGPDGQRHWLSADGRTGFGHARLSIIDLATGDQPILSEDGRTSLVVNGEFYGFETIQKELEAVGHRLRTRSDSEIALHLYQDVGPECLHRLRGEFALALWDDAHQRLFAARDRFGIKPLYYAVHDGILYLASEVKALFAAGVPARWSREGVHTAFAFDAAQGGTLYAGIHQVPPGHYLIASGGRVDLHRYWDFNYPPATATTPTRSDVDYAAEFRAALDEAVRLRLRADVPVGCYLSGGLDSCAVLGVASKLHPDPIRAFTLTFDRVEYDEGEVAREMAALAGAEYTPIPIVQDDLADHFADAIAQAEATCVNAHCVAKYLLSRAVRDAGYKVVLTGEGSDEILGGYAHFRRDVLLYNQQGQDAGTVTAMLEEMARLNPVSRGLMMAHGEVANLTYVRRVLGFVPSWMEAFSARLFKFTPLLEPGMRTESLVRTPYLPLVAGIDVAAQLTDRDPLNQSLYLWGKVALPGYILTMLGDRMEMAHSIEGRVPFLDHKLFETLRSFPIAMKSRGMTEKYVLREAARDVISDTVYRRQKHPFLSPPATLNVGGRLDTMMQDTLRGSMLAAVPFLDQAAVVNLLDALPAMDEGARVAYDQILMQILSFCVLQDRYRLAA